MAEFWAELSLFDPDFEVERLEGLESMTGRYNALTPEQQAVWEDDFASCQATFMYWDHRDSIVQFLLPEDRAEVHRRAIALGFS